MTVEETIDRAVRLHREGDLRQADILYAGILREDPSHVDALHFSGVVCHQQKEYVQAEQRYREALRLRPRYTAALTNLGLLLAETGRVEEALQCLREAVDLESGHTAARINLSLILNRAGRFAESAAVCREAVAQTPDAAEAWCNLGVALRGMKQHASARDALSRAIAINPRYVLALNNLGNVLADEGRTNEARAAYTRALAVDPAYGSPLNNLAKLLREEGDLVRAAELYRRALSLDPHAAESHWGLAHVLLLQGDFAEGWKQYEWRWALPDAAADRPRNLPLWHGEPVRGKRLLLCAEQGLGDAIQFVRYASRIAALGGEVVIEAPGTLVRLLRQAEGVSHVCAAGDDVPVCDAFAPLLSLPSVFQDTAATIPANVPYIHIPPDLDAFWKSRIAGDPAGVRVGLVFAGSPTHENDHRRSCTPEQCAPLLHQQGVVVYSLQKDFFRSLTPDVSGALVDHMDWCGDVLETAGLVHQMDLVITVDTMVAHLAGALGVPVWLMLPFAPDWRWMLHCEDSPWYPSMRLFRQHRPGDWQDVVLRIGKAFEDMLTQHALDSHRTGDRARAAQMYRAVLAANPSAVDARYLLGVLASETGQTGGALGHCRRVLELDPEHAEAWNTIGNCLQHQGDLSGAENAYRQAVHKDPVYGDALYNLGSCLCVQGRLEEAEHALSKALSAGAEPGRASNNLGLVLYRQEKIAEAIGWYRRSLATSPDLVDAHWNLAHALLHAGLWEEGWKEFEWRWKMPEFRTLASAQSAPGWDGKRLDGRRLLVWAEQGFGDTIFFLRYLPALLELGGHVIVEVPAPLHRLVELQSDRIHVVTRGEPLPDHDVQVPLLSLPALMGYHGPSGFQDLYLRSDSGERARWEAQLLPFGHRLRIGVVWAGSRTNAAGQYRSLPLSSLKGLARIPGIVVISLQKGIQEGTFATVFPPECGVDWTVGLDDFAGTAALISCLDVVITIDTAVAHLAGALGADVWTLLSRPHDWRYGIDERVSTWYPRMRLVRQKRGGEWESALQEVANILTELVRGHANNC